MAVSVTFDLALSNKIYKENIKSLLIISHDNISLIAAQNIEYFVDKHLERSDQNTEWYDKSSHLSNIEWILLNSIYASVYSFFEYHIYALVNVVESRSKSKIRLKDIAGKGIVQSFTYLHLVGELNSAGKGTNFWQDLMRFQNVRNIIVHNGGVMMSDVNRALKDHELFTFLEERNVIMAGVLGHIRIREAKIIESFMNLTFTISDALVQEINDKYPEI
jgi:hypothetical protein